MKRLIMVILALIILSGLIFVGCSTTPAPAKVFNLKYSHEQAVTAYYSIYGHVPYAQAIEKATNGAVKILQPFRLASNSGQM